MSPFGITRPAPHATNCLHYALLRYPVDGVRDQKRRDGSVGASCIACCGPDLGTDSFVVPKAPIASFSTIELVVTLFHRIAHQRLTQALQELSVSLLQHMYCTKTWYKQTADISGGFAPQPTHFKLRRHFILSVCNEE